MRISDWSSDVCSSDLAQRIEIGSDHAQRDRRLDRWAILEFLDDDLGAGDRVEACAQAVQKQGRARSVISLELHEYFRIVRRDRKSVVEGKSVSVRLDLGCRRIIKKKTKITQKT